MRSGLAAKTTHNVGMDTISIRVSSVSISEFYTISGNLILARLVIPFYESLTHKVRKQGKENNVFAKVVKAKILVGFVDSPFPALKWEQSDYFWRSVWQSLQQQTVSSLFLICRFYGNETSLRRDS